MLTSGWDSKSSGLKPRAGSSPASGTRPLPDPRPGTLRHSFEKQGSRMPPMPPITQALLMINTVAFFLDWLSGGVLSRYLALWPIASGAFLPFQVVTYAFMHGG